MSLPLQKLLRAAVDQRAVEYMSQTVPSERTSDVR